MKLSEEPEFRIRTYGFGELAQEYLPGIHPSSASRRLNAWINRNQKLVESLRAKGYKRKDKTLTPAQVELIVEYLGRP